MLFIELLPKHLAHKNPEKYTYFASIIVAVFDLILYPASYLIASNSSLISNKLTKLKHNITIDDLSEALNLTSNQMNEDENILKGIVKFSNIDVREIMKSRVDVLPLNTIQVLKIFYHLLSNQDTPEVPVYSGSFDNIKGILYIKDLLEHFSKEDDFNWQALLRPPYFVSEYKKD
ncbi:MAG: CNNM domain-containing protein [Marinilabiliales bacterium]|nr:CNNM domain-containing protein [Marinilabiliales bacterium]